MTFLNQALRGKNDALPYALTFLLVTFGYFVLGTIGLLSVLIVAATQRGINAASALQQLADILQNPVAFGISRNLVFLGMLLPFVSTLLCLFVGVRYIHKRPFATLINAFSAIRWSRFFIAAAVWFGITAMMEGVNYALHPTDYKICFEAAPFAGTLLISLLILPLQTSCEEFVFRGWLMQGIAGITTKRWIPLVVTAILFGTMHFANPEVAKYGLAPMAVYYIGFGLFMGLVAILDDGLELSLGLHFGNNFFGATMVSFTSSALQTNTVFRTSDPDAYTLLGLSVAGATAAFFIFKKLYNLAPIAIIFEEQD
jgi:membrane protease YdiL (CAAX protease family)